MPLPNPTDRDFRTPHGPQPATPDPHDAGAALAPIDLDPAFIRALPRWRTGTLPDGRVLIELTLLADDRTTTEIRRILLQRTVAAELARDLLDLATALHPET